MSGDRPGTMSNQHPLQGAVFMLSAATEPQLPAIGPPEIAVAGRSNAGKSTAINVLANRTRLAFASRTPGRTQQINFFRLRGGALLADLPGYGYAAVSRSLKRHWQAFLAHYLRTRQSLLGLVLVVDARHGLADPDRLLLSEYLPSGRPVLLLATKMDKLGRSAQRAAEAVIAKAIAAEFPAFQRNVTIVAFSAPDRLGVVAAEATLANWLDSVSPDQPTPTATVPDAR